MVIGLLPYLLWALLGAVVVLALGAIAVALTVLTWWAGWTARFARAQPGEAIAPATEPPAPAARYLVYLSGVGDISGSWTSRHEQAFLEAIAAAVPGLAIVEDIFAYSPTEDDMASERLLGWFWRWLHAQPRGVLAIPSWGKFWLAVLDLYDYRGLNPLPPELYTLPRWLPLHPSRYYCHTRYIYLGLAYLYGRRFRADLGPLRDELRQELYGVPYENIDFAAHRHDVVADEPVHARDPDGGEQPSDRRRDEADQERDDGGDGEARPRVHAERHERDARDEEDDRHPGEEHVQRDLVANFLRLCGVSPKRAAAGGGESGAASGGSA